MKEETTSIRESLIKAALDYKTDFRSNEDIEKFRNNYIAPLTIEEVLLLQDAYVEKSTNYKYPINSKTFNIIVKNLIEGIIAGGYFYFEPQYNGYAPAIVEFCNRFSGAASAKKITEIDKNEIRFMQVILNTTKLDSLHLAKFITEMMAVIREPLNDLMDIDACLKHVGERIEYLQRPADSDITDGKEDEEQEQVLQESKFPEEEVLENIN